MKIQYLCALILSAGCSTTKSTVKSHDKLEIIKVEETTEFYVFTTIDNAESGGKDIVLLEKAKGNPCKPFQRFIIRDSITNTYKLKSGTSFDIIGANGFTIDGIRVSEVGKSPRIISGCKCFVD